jgi:hypothetical protein
MGGRALFLEPAMNRMIPLALGLGAGFVLGVLSASAPKATVYAQSPSSKDTPLADTVSMVSTLYLYQSYLNVGLLADCKAEEVYDEKQVKALLASTLMPLEAVEKQLQGLTKSLPTKVERDRVEAVQRAIPALRKQGMALHLYWDTEKAEHAKDYEAARKDCWRSLAALMGTERK